VKLSLIGKVLAAALTLLGLSVPATAQDYPNRPLRMIVPFPPGGPTDLVARVLGEAMAADLGQPVVIENKAGANGNVGVEFVATVPLALVIHPSIPAKTVPEFIAWAKANAGKLSYASTGVGSVTHLGAVQFMKLAGIEAQHVPFRGSAPALTGLAGNHVHFMTDTVNSSVPFVTGGQLRGLAVLGTKRVSLVPDLPTLAEVGMKDFEIGAWQGIMAPSGTPQPVIDRLNASIMKALASDTVKEKLAIQGATILGSTPAAYRDYIEAEIVRWAAVVKESGAKAE
jgi:tripartite-type tricarboxylate transporter receptor subunit TctC